MAPTDVIERLSMTAQELNGVGVLRVSGELD
jgi:hypothetical protein